MKAKTSKTADTSKTLQLAETVRTLGNIHEDDQQALYGLLAMLGGLELLRHAAVAGEAWIDAHLEAFGARQAAAPPRPNCIQHLDPVDAPDAGED